MNQIIAGGAVIGLGLTLCVHQAAAAGRGNGAGQQNNAPIVSVDQNANGTVSSTTTQPLLSGSLSPSTTPTIQSGSGSDEKVNVRGTILRLPF
jgi:hypothetical protein